MQRGSIALLASVLLLATTHAAHADPNGSTVTGVVELPPRADRKALPVRSPGFTKRIRGPLKEPQKANPRSDLVVFLEGGPVAPDDAKPGKDAVRYELVGEGFASNIFPFVVGTPVEVKNSGHTSPRLAATGSADAIESAPVSPRGVRPVKAPQEPFKTLEIRDQDSAHTRGVLLSLPHSYFSLVSADGKYEIKGVPAGTWTVKVWYRDGWITGTKTAKVTVAAKRPAKAPTFKLPADMATSAATSAEKGK